MDYALNCKFGANEFNTRPPVDYFAVGAYSSYSRVSS
jgi:hypothetical protein